MSSLRVFQSLWAMEKSNAVSSDPAINEDLRMISEAGFDGVSLFLKEDGTEGKYRSALQNSDLAVEVTAFPRSDDDLRRTLERASGFDPVHLNLQADVRPKSLDEAVALVERWITIAGAADFPVYFETHRNRLTSDMHFTLDILQHVPDMALLADLSHYLVGREFSVPLDNVIEADVRRILDACKAFHGRIGSNQQIQIEASFAHHAPWVELFRNWWQYGFEGWIRRNSPSQDCVFTCELGPAPYSITTQGGHDSTDRWQESLIIRDFALDTWNKAMQAVSQTGNAREA